MSTFLLSYFPTFPYPSACRVILKYVYFPSAFVQLSEKLCNFALKRQKECLKYYYT